MQQGALSSRIVEKILIKNYKNIAVIFHVKSTLKPEFLCKKLANVWEITLLHFLLIFVNIIEIFCHCVRGGFLNIKKSFLPYVILHYYTMTNCRRIFRVQITSQVWAIFIENRRPLRVVMTTVLLRLNNYFSIFHIFRNPHKFLTYHVAFSLIYF